MLRSDTLKCYALARYATIILSSLLFLLFAWARPSDAEATNSAKPGTSSSLQAYVTTAGKLNVREFPNSKAKILKVVNKGTVLSVQATAAGGWLKLAGGGYINGKYAKLAKKKPDAPVKALSYSKSNFSAGAAAIKATLPLSGVESVSGLTEEEIGVIFEDTDLQGHGLEEAILGIEDEYGINAYFTIAVMKLESGNGESRLAGSKNNLFGMSNGKGGYLRFKTKADSVRKFGELISENYIGEGYDTIEKISGKYCPPNKEWSALVKNIIKRDRKLLEGASV
jgi:Muramidase (flagellum-specific)